MHILDFGYFLCHFECNEAEKWAKHADFVGIRPKETNETVANPSFSFPWLEWKMDFFSISVLFWPNATACQYLKQHHLLQNFEKCINT